MMRSLWISKTGMEAQQTKLDQISNNLANVSTNGYKRASVVFEAPARGSVFSRDRRGSWPGLSAGAAVEASARTTAAIPIRFMRSPCTVNSYHLTRPG